MLADRVAPNLRSLPSLPPVRRRRPRRTSLVSSRVHEYDIAGRVLKDTVVGVGTPAVSKSTTYTYYPGGELKSKLMPDGQSSGTYLYNESGQLRAITNPSVAGGFLISSITYNPRGQATQIVYGNGAVATYDYDDTDLGGGTQHRGFLVRVRVANGTTQLIDQYYRRDKSGLITVVDDFLGPSTPRDWTYAYDSIGRLTVANNWATGSPATSPLTRHQLSGFGRWREAPTCAEPDLRRRSHLRCQWQYVDL
jgi:hypothetical protein